MKKMKKLISAILCAALMLLLVPISSTALPSIDAVTGIYVPEYYEEVSELSSSDDYLEEELPDNFDWCGYAKNYSVYLEYDIKYNFEITLEANENCYMDRALVLVPDYGTSMDDALAYDCIVNSGDDNQLSLSIEFTPESSGYYTIISYGYCRDDKNNVIFSGIYHTFKYYRDCYLNVDYSTELKVGDEGAVSTIDGVEPFVNHNDWSGYAYGFNAELKAGKTYRFDVVIKDLDNAIYYMDRALAAFNDDLTGDFYYDLIAFYGDSVEEQDAFTVSLYINPAKSGRYKLLAWGWLLDEEYEYQIFGSDRVKLEYSIKEVTLDTVNIRTPQDLVDFSDAVNDGDYYKRAVRVNLLADVDMKNVPFDSIAAYEVANIIFEGNNYMISHLDKPLFEGAYSISFNEIIVKGDLAFNKDKDGSYHSTTGIVIGSAEMVTLDNVIVVGSISLDGFVYAQYVGGAVGSTATLKMSNSYVAVDVMINNVRDVSDIGGVIGEAFGNVTARDNVCEGEIYITAQNLDEAFNIGGFIGEDNCESSVYENCTVNGAIEIDRSAEDTTEIFYYENVGGFVGLSASASVFDYCHTNVEIVAFDNDSVGGFVGRIDCDGGRFYNCSAIGYVFAQDYVGGFTGNAEYYADYYNCYAACLVEGLENVGGFVGYDYDGYFQNCYAAGAAGGLRNIGAFIGYEEGSDYLFQNLFCSDAGFRAVGYIDSDEDCFNYVDFESDSEILDMVDSLNAYVKGFTYLRRWSQTERNEFGTPIFEETPQYLLGDANCDGCIDQYDYILVKRHYFGTRFLTDSEELSADVNLDGKIDQYDYILIKRHYFGTYVIGG